jgi:hypothetical protein
MELTNEHYRVGKVAYNAYIKQSGGVSLVTGDKLPEFDALKQTIKDAWAASGIAVNLDREMSQRAPNGVFEQPH